MATLYLDYGWNYMVDINNIQLLYHIYIRKMYFAHIDVNELISVCLHVIHVEYS